MKLNRSPKAKRKRSKLVRDTVVRAVMKKESERIREAYEKDPDTAVEATDWSLFEEYKA